jgi:radical SAM protein with 4Fe4S-binding SPASM domain
LSLGEIEKISKSFGYIFNLLITGGEPFVHNELDQICSIFYRNNQSRYIYIPTNGILSEKIESMTEKILKSCKDANIYVELSLDGIGKTHDFIRGVEGNFNNLNETCERLHRLRNRYKNLALKVNITYSSYNQHQIEEVYRHAKDVMEIKDVYICPVWGNPKDPQTKTFAIDSYTNILKIWEKKRKKDAMNLFDKLRFVVRKSINREVLDVMRKGKLDSPCTAIRKLIIINEEGDVYPCPMITEKIGSLRECDYDIKKVMKSPKRFEIEKKYRINSDCFCYWDCAIYNNIIYNWKNLLFFAKFMLPKKKETIQ